VKRVLNVTTVATALVTLSLTQTISATDIKWVNDAFEHSMKIAPGKVAEVCGDVFPERPIDWRFTSSESIEFNIHRHEKSDVIYHTRSFRTKEQTGNFKPAATYEWCWMWTNDSAANAEVRLQLRRK
jgi:hypothetical protein